MSDLPFRCIGRCGRPGAFSSTEPCSASLAGSPAFLLQLFGQQYYCEKKVRQSISRSGDCTGSPPALTELGPREQRCRRSQTTTHQPSRSRPAHSRPRASARHSSRRTVARAAARLARAMFRARRCGQRCGCWPSRACALRSRQRAIAWPSTWRRRGVAADLPSAEEDDLAEAILRDRSARRLDETVTAAAWRGATVRSQRRY